MIAHCFISSMSYGCIITIMIVCVLIRFYFRIIFNCLVLFAKLQSSNVLTLVQLSKGLS